ncbi:ogr/Delta-like zinc finger family protein [Methylobacter sp. G7]|uniref:ogr/Delta-like zinc finger family protein n=1 Tax=Methylobacter sp. G7 TaxID=3230117 RepID=UPI003D8040F1
MRVICPHCHKKALITSTNELTGTVKDLYCICTNAKECGASFVFTLAYKHDLNPPQRTTLQIAATLINHLQPEQRKRLQVDLFG